MKTTKLEMAKAICAARGYPLSQVLRDWTLYSIQTAYRSL